PGSPPGCRRETGCGQARIARPRSRGPGTESCRWSRRPARRTPRRRGGCQPRQPASRPAAPPRAPAPPTSAASNRPSRQLQWSVCVLVGPNPRQRDQEDLDVECETPVLNVIEVVDQPLFHGGLASQVVGLGPAGQPRPNQVAVLVSRQPGAELGDELGALGTRTDQA